MSHKEMREGYERASDKVLDALIDITQHRDQESLEIALLQTIAMSVNPISIEFYRVTPSFQSNKLLKTAELSGQQHFQANHYQYKLVEITGDAQQALHKNRIIQRKRTAGFITTHIPIYAANSAIALLQLQTNAPLSHTNEDIITGLLQIYPNFLSVVRDNESDALTGLLNRETFDDKISSILQANAHKIFNADEVDDERRLIHPGAHWLGVIDIDFFKKINDNFGHLYGDEVLILLANIMRECFRANDLLYRYGGEEFVIVLSPCSTDDAPTIFERFRERVETYQFPQVGNITISIGYVKFGDHDFPNEVVDHADQALYYAKDHGRNRVCSYENLLATGEIEAPAAIESDIELF